MKKLMKKIAALVALASISGYSFGYNYGISNLTNKPLVVRLKESGLANPMYKVIQPDSRAEFNFGGGLCLESIHVSPYDAAKGNNFANYPLYSAEMVMESKAVYEASVKGAKDLLKGLDTLGCKALEVALKASPESSGKKEVANKLSDLFGKDDKDKDKSKGGKPLDKLVTELKDKLKNADGTWKTIPVASVIKALNDNKALLKDADFKTIEDHLKKGENKEAIAALELSALLASVEYNAHVYEDVNANIDTSANNKEKCTWGLAKIGQASGTLKGNDLCHSREFQILATDQPGTKTIGTKKFTIPNEWVAITVYGE